MFPVWMHVVRENSPQQNIKMICFLFYTRRKLTGEASLSEVGLDRDVNHLHRLRPSTSQLK